MSARGWKGASSAAYVYLSAEAFTKVAQTVVILGFAATSTKDEYGSFVFVLAYHLLASSIVSSGTVEALVAARSRRPLSQARALMRPILILSAALAGVVLVGSAGWVLHGLVTARTQPILAVAGATLSALGIGVVRNASIVIQFEGRDAFAAATRSIQLFVGYAFGGLGIALHREDPVGAFFIGYAIGVCAVGLWVARSESRIPIDASPTGDLPALMRDTLIFLPIGLFGWVFGYGFSWLTALASRPLDQIAEFAVALSATFFCPMILTAVYSTWSPRYASGARHGPDSDKDWGRLNQDVWRHPILAIGAIGVLALVAWDRAMLMLGHGMLGYRFLEDSLALILAGYVVLSLHYVATTVFLHEQATALFFRTSLLGNVVGIVVAAVLLAASPFSLAVAYAAALAIRGVVMAIVAWYRWRTPMPVAELCMSAALLAVGYATAKQGSLPLSIAMAAAALSMLALNGIRLRGSASTHV